MSERIFTKDVIAKIAEDHDLSYAQSKRICEGVLDEIVEAVKDGKTVTLTGFGRFDLRERKARQVKFNDEKHMSEPHMYMGFKMSKSLRERLG